VRSRHWPWFRACRGSTQPVYSDRPFAIGGSFWVSRLVPLTTFLLRDEATAWSSTDEAWTLRYPDKGPPVFYSVVATPPTRPWYQL